MLALAISVVLALAARIALALKAAQAVSILGRSVWWRWTVWSREFRSSPLTSSMTVRSSTTSRTVQPASLARALCIHTQMGLSTSSPTGPGGRKRVSDARSKRINTRSTTWFGVSSPVLGQHLARRFAPFTTLHHDFGLESRLGMPSIARPE